MQQPHCSLCFSFCFTSMPHELLTSFISMQCMAMPFLSSLPFHHCCVVALCSTLFPFHGYAWYMPLPHATRYWNILEHSSVDAVQTCTYICSSIKCRKCQPENSSLVLLVFSLLSQRDHLHNRLLVPLVCSPLVLDSLESQLTLRPFGLFQRHYDSSWVPPQRQTEIHFYARHLT